MDVYDKKRERNMPYNRIFEIDKAIAGNAYPNSEELARQLGVSVSTIGRDIEFLKYMMDAPIEYDYARRGFYYSQKNFRLTTYIACEEDIMAAHYALAILAQYKDTPIYAPLKKIFDINKSLLELGGQTDSAFWFRKRFVFLSEPSARIAHDLWFTLLKAMKENKAVRITYRGAWSKAEQEHYIQPYQLVAKNGNWYLAGPFVGHDTVLLFALQRIQSITALDTTYTFPENYSYDDETKGGIELFKNEEDFACRVKFFNEAVTYVSERAWFENQQNDKQEDGSLVVSFTAGNLYELVRWILSQGKNALPLEPPELVAAWSDHAAAMNAMTR